MVIVGSNLFTATQISTSHHHTLDSFSLSLSFQTKLLFKFGY